MPDTTQKIDPSSLRNYLLIAWKWRWLLLLLPVFAAGVTFVFSRMSTPIYQAATKLLINETPTAGESDYTALLESQQETNTYAQMITNRLLLQSVIADLGLNTTEKALADAITVDVISNTRLVTITVEGTNPARAAAIANALATHFINQLQTLENSSNQQTETNLQKQMQQIDAQVQTTSASLDSLGLNGDPAERARLTTQLAEYRQAYSNVVASYESVRLAEISTNTGVVQLEPAIAPQIPVRPRVLVNTLLAALMGLVLATGSVVLIEALDDTIRTPEDIANYLGLPIFGVIPLHENTPGKPITIAAPRSPACDAYRTLRSNIHFASVDRPLKKLLITSSVPLEGKSTVSVNLSVAMAQNGQHITLLDSDFRHPSIYRYLGSANHQGLSNLLAEPQLTLDGNVQSTEVANLRVLTTGSLPPNPTELLNSEKMSHILALLGQDADLLVVDSPPIMAITDAAVLASRMDGVLLVIKPGVTQIHAAQQAVEQLHRAKANLLGVILNAVDFKRDGYYNNYYHTYHYHYAEDDKKQGLLEKLRKPPAT